MRILSLIKKEFLATLNDKRSMIVIIIPPILQIFIFAYSVSFELKNASFAIFNQSDSAVVREQISKIGASKFTKELKSFASLREAEDCLIRKEVLGVLYFDEGANLNLILDGRRSNLAQIAHGYISNALNQKSSNIIVRNFYNPNLENSWWIVPNLSASIVMIMALILTALSIPRELEAGTFEQLIASPLSPFEIMSGKLIVSVIFSFFIGIGIFIIAVFFFEIAFMSSFLLYLLGVLCFVFCISCIGIFLALISSTSQQALLWVFFFILPSIMLSGFATPTENMPLWLQKFSYLIPLTHYIQFVKILFLKGITFTQSLEFLLPLLAFGVLAFMFSLIFFKSRVLK